MYLNDQARIIVRNILEVYPLEPYMPLSGEAVAPDRRKFSPMWRIILERLNLLSRSQASSQHQKLTHHVARNIPFAVPRRHHHAHNNLTIAHHPVAYPYADPQTITMGKKKRGHPDVEELLGRPWCYYCSSTRTTARDLG